MIETLHPAEHDDPSVVAIMRAGADELDAVIELMETVRLQAWPQFADDTYGLLGIHEATFGLPVEPEGVSIATRRASVKSAVGSRRDGRASKWLSRMNSLM